ncbi:MAG: aspartate aminotransferase family protein [Gammaproteobacteria bacterium]|nr:aspartate aminotransferase family protein [Gammaproteobacteria bacterium]
MFAKVLRTIGFDRCYVRAEGAYLWDEKGTRYLDMLAGYGVFNVGRNHPYIKDALCRFMAEDYPSLVQMEAPLLSGLLAAELKKRVSYPALDKVYFTNSGTESVETAIKFARCATGRSAIVFARKGFHGLTNGSLAINGDQVFRTGFGDLLPDCHAVPLGDLQALEHALRTQPCAAFVIEPIQGKGVNIPPEGYLREAADLCRRHGTLVVADEVQTGMGRTGRFLAAEHEPGFQPDLVLLSKALSGGFVPVGAVLCSNSVSERVFSSMDRAVVHSSTFGQNSLAMVAGLATLTLMDELRLTERATRLGDYLGQGLQAMQPRFEFLRAVRWRGLMIGIEFGEPRSFGLRGAWRIAHGMDQSLFPQAITIPLLDEHKVLTQVAGHHIDVIKLIPPLVVNEQDCDWFLDAFEKVMLKLHRFPGPVWEALSKIGKNALRGRGRVASVAGSA